VRRSDFGRPIAKHFANCELLHSPICDPTLSSSGAVIAPSKGSNHMKKIVRYRTLSENQDFITRFG
jgi:hypothetical protein